MATKNQEAVFNEVVKQAKSKTRKISVSKAMRDVGLSPSFSEQPQQMTNSKGWKELVNTRLSDSFVTARLRKLFDQKKVEYFSFNKNMSDETIRAAVEDAGLTVINISYTDQGKLAWYSTDDVMAVTKALDMTNKIKGVYLADKAPPTNVTINHTLFYKPEFQQTLRNAEAEMKRMIENAEPTQDIPPQE